MADVAKGMMSLAGGPLVEEDEVDIWFYLYQAESRYLVNFCAMSADHLVPWRGKYMVHPDKICWERAIFTSRFR